MKKLLCLLGMCSILTMGVVNTSSAQHRVKYVHKRGWSGKAKGATIGAGAGALGGALISHSVKGGLIGAGIGAGAGYLIGRHHDKHHPRPIIYKRKYK